MTAADLIVEGREFCEEQMIDTCVITRSQTSRQFNTGTGTYTEGATVTVYEGKCQVQIPGVADATTPSIEGGSPTVQQVLVKVPVDGTRYRIRDLIRIVTAECDPDLAGRRFSLTAGHNKTYATARRLQCEEVEPDV